MKYHDKLLSYVKILEKKARNGQIPYERYVKLLVTLEEWNSNNGKKVK